MQRSFFWAVAIFCVACASSEVIKKGAAGDGAAGATTAGGAGGSATGGGGSSGTGGAVSGGQGGLDASTPDGARPFDASVGDAALCADGIKNGAESDVDCGGACSGCGPGHSCFADADCATGPCESGKCAEICPPGKLMTGLDSSGHIQCDAVDAATRSAINQSCYVYLGWNDGCTGCTSAPSKWGYTNDTDCLNGAGTNDTCTTPTLDGKSVRLFGLNTDGDVDANDKFHVGLHCRATSPQTSTTSAGCPSGQFATGVSAGTVQCASLADLVTAYFGDKCSMYLGWHDSCNPCSSAPAKWGNSNDTTCNVVGANDTCSQPTLGTESVRLAGINTEGDVNQDDSFYLGLHCAGATTASGSQTGSCPTGQFVTKIEASGAVVCSSAANLIESYVRSGCSSYLGWSDSCNGCATDPTKWGRANDTTCQNGAGDGLCITTNLGGQDVQLFVLNTDGNVNDDDKFFVGLECF